MNLTKVLSSKRASETSRKDKPESKHDKIKEPAQKRKTLEKSDSKFSDNDAQQISEIMAKANTFFEYDYGKVSIVGALLGTNDSSKLTETQKIPLAHNADNSSANPATYVPTTTTTSITQSHPFISSSQSNYFTQSSSALPPRALPDIPTSSTSPNLSMITPTISGVTTSISAPVAPQRVSSLKQKPVATSFSVTESKTRPARPSISYNINSNITELGKELIKYFAADNDIQTKNRRLANMQTKNILEITLHDEIFRNIFGYTFEEFLLTINGHTGDIPRFHAQANTFARGSALSFEPDLAYVADEKFHDNSNVSVIQKYATSHVNAYFNFKGHKTFPSNNPIDKYRHDVVGINHNTITLGFSDNANTKYFIQIETSGSYRENGQTSKDDTVVDNAKNLLLSIHHTQDSKTPQIIDVRMLKGIAKDSLIFKENNQVMRKAIEEWTNFERHCLWLNSFEFKNEFIKDMPSCFPVVEEHKKDIEGLLSLIKTLETDDESLKPYISHIKKVLLKFIEKNDFKEHSKARLIFGLLVVLLTAVPENKRPILLAGCMSAKDRTGAFIFCAIIISTIFFHRVFSGKFKHKPTEILSFLDKGGRVKRKQLDDEELNLIKALLNNPIIYNILSKFGIGEYNNKNLAIVRAFLDRIPGIDELLITKALIKTGG